MTTIALPQAARRVWTRPDAASLKLEADRLVYRRANLEDVFLRLTGRGLAEE